MTSLKTKLFNSKCLKQIKALFTFLNEVLCSLDITLSSVSTDIMDAIFYLSSNVLFSLWLWFKSVSELRLTQAFYTSGHVSGAISGGMHRTFPTVKNPLHLTNQNASRLGQRLRSRAYRNFIGCRWLPFKVYRYVNQSCFVCAGQPATCRDDYLE